MEHSNNRINNKILFKYNSLETINDQPIKVLEIKPNQMEGISPRLPSSNTSSLIKESFMDKYKLALVKDYIRFNSWDFITSPIVYIPIAITTVFVGISFSNYWIPILPLVINLFTDYLFKPNNDDDPLLSDGEITPTQDVIKPTSDSVENLADSLNSFTTAIEIPEIPQLNLNTSEIPNINVTSPAAGPTNTSTSINSTLSPTDSNHTSSNVLGGVAIVYDVPNFNTDVSPIENTGINNGSPIRTLSSNTSIDSTSTDWSDSISINDPNNNTSSPATSSPSTSNPVNVPLPDSPVSPSSPPAITTVITNTNPRAIASVSKGSKLDKYAIRCKMELKTSLLPEAKKVTNRRQSK